MNIAPSFGHVRRGFTLIELLVVIAIIGILSSVVLASLNTARAKGTDAKIESEIRSVQVNAEIYYDNNSNSYGTTVSACNAGMFNSSSNPNIAQIITDMTNATSQYDPTCVASSTAYAISHRLTAPSGTVYFCADSTGKVGTTSGPASGTTLCS